MRGRPVKSEIRQNIIDILAVKESGYGYELYKIYQALFPSCTREVVYYHLKKGLAIGEFEIAKTERQEGDYSWGPVAEKTYYKLGENAAPRKNKRVEALIKRKSS